MNNSSPDHLETDIHQTPTSSDLDGQDIGPQHMVEEVDEVIYRYVKMATDTEIPSERIHLESPEVNLGDVVEIDTENGKKDYFCVDHIVKGVEGEVTTVYLVRARNSLWKSLLLLAILGVGWYVIDFVLSHFF